MTNHPNSQPPPALPWGNAGYQHQAAGPTYVAPAACHSGLVNVLTYQAAGQTEPSGLYIGGWSRGASNDTLGRAVIDLTDATYERSANPRNEAARQAFAATLALLERPAPWLTLPLKDYAAPWFGRKIFLSLANDIVGLLAAGTDVAVVCHGGHGRSGTLVAALCGHILDWHDLTPDPVSWLRDIYCQEAVETKDQIAWVWEVLQLPKELAMPASAKAKYVQTTTGVSAKITTRCLACGKMWEHWPATTSDICDNCWKLGFRDNAPQDWPALRQKHGIAEPTKPAESTTPAPDPKAGAAETPAATNTPASTVITSNQIVILAQNQPNPDGYDECYICETEYRLDQLNTLSDPSEPQITLNLCQKHTDAFLASGSPSVLDWAEEGFLRAANQPPSLPASLDPKTCSCCDGIDPLGLNYYQDFHDLYGLCESCWTRMLAAVGRDAETHVKIAWIKAHLFRSAGQARQ